MSLACTKAFLTAHEVIVIVYVYQPLVDEL